MALLPLLLGGSSKVEAASVNEDNWTLNYSHIDDDGIAITYAYYDGRLVMSRATMPYIPVEYDDGGRGLDELTSDFLVAGPYKLNLAGGFRIEAVYAGANWPTCGTYKYTQRFDFYSDGRFEPYLLIQGPGKASDHNYHFRLRLDLDVDGWGGDSSYQWDAGQWVQATTETTTVDDDDNAAGNYEWIAYDNPWIWRIGSFDLSATITTLTYGSSEQDYVGLTWLQHPSGYDNNEYTFSGDLVFWNSSVRRNADGSSNCYTTSMTPGPFTEPWPGAW